MGFKIIDACIFVYLYLQVELHEYVKVGRTLYSVNNSNQLDRIELVPHRTLNHKVPH